MDVQKLVQTIQERCAELGISPTVAARESGAGKDVISNMKRKGTQPSFDKLCMLANYLGVTVSELLGEPLPESSASTPQEQEFARLFAQLRPEQQELVIAQLHGILDANDRNASSSE